MASAGLTTGSLPTKAAPLARRFAVLAAIAAVGAAFFFAPQLGLRWPCPMFTLLRIPCPSCGLTRAVRFVAHGDFGAATHIHPLWMVVLPFVGVLAIAELGGYMRTGRWQHAQRLPGIKQAGAVVLVLLFAVWIARFFGAFGGPVPG